MTTPPFEGHVFHLQTPALGVFEGHVGRIANAAAGGEDKYRPTGKPGLGGLKPLPTLPGGVPGAFGRPRPGKPTSPNKA